MPRLLFDPGTTAGTADLLIRHDQHGDRSDARQWLFQQNSQCVQRHDDAGFHVADPRPGQESAVIGERPLRRGACRPHGVGVAQHQ
jgi:hypothetical protein